MASMRARIARQELTRLLGEIEQHGAGLEHRDRLAAAGRCAIDQRRNAVVRGDGEEFRLELLALADIHRHDVVGQPGLLEEDRDLVPIGRGPIVEVDHRHVPLRCDQSDGCSIISNAGAIYAPTRRIFAAHSSLTRQAFAAMNVRNRRTSSAIPA
jgi:hypothetical protein